MGIFNAAGTRLTKAGVTTGAPADPELVLDFDIYRSRPFGPQDGNAAGSIRQLVGRAGDVVRQSWLDAQFPAPTVDTIVPATGPAVGGTEVTITGSNLDGVTGVTFDGAAGTGLAVDSSTKIRVTTPAGSAGPADVVVTDDAGTATESGGFTYA